MEDDAFPLAVFLVSKPFTVESVRSLSAITGWGLVGVGPFQISTCHQQTTPYTKPPQHKRAEQCNAAYQICIWMQAHDRIGGNCSTVAIPCSGEFLQLENNVEQSNLHSRSKHITSMEVTAPF